MKAASDIDLRNLRAFDKEVLKAGESSYFTVKKSEVLKDVLSAHGYTDEEVAEAEMRLLKGSSKLVILEDDKDKLKAKKAVDEKESYQKRYDELSGLKKAEQVKLLESLGVGKDKSPATEDDRVKLIIDMEKKKK